jgi:hypothetical protein
MRYGFPFGIFYFFTRLSQLETKNVIYPHTGINLKMYQGFSRHYF